MTIKYRDLPTEMINNKRFYKIAEDVWYPSITTVLGTTAPEEKKQAIKNWQNWLGPEKAAAATKEAARRGTEIHLLIERYLNGETIDPKQHLPADIALFNGLKLKLKKINKVYAQEMPLHSDLLKVAGRCDLFAEYEGVPVIVDYKTSSGNATQSKLEDYWLQTTFYAIAHNEQYGTNIENMVILMVSANGLPQAFKKPITVDLVDRLMDRINKFYEEL